MATLIRDAVAKEPDRPVLAVLNRKGRARLLACGRCRSLLRCDACGTALVQLERPAQGELAVLRCLRCGSSVPAVCASCGPTRPRIVRPGVARVRDDLAALTGLEVAEIGRAGTGPDGGLPDAPVLVGTEAVLHRVTSASLVVFLDFDRELLAPAIGPASRRWLCSPSPHGWSAAGAGKGAWLSGRDCRITRSWPPPCMPTPAGSPLPRSLDGHSSVFPRQPHSHW